MWDRFALTTPQAVPGRFGLAESAPRLPPPRTDVAPGEVLPVVVETARGRRLAHVFWGFHPPWMRAMRGSAPTTAPAESVATSRLFSGAFRRRRCLVPADAFEVASTAGAVTVRLRDRSLFALAGIVAGDPFEGEQLATLAILTLPAGPLVAPFHDRVPAILRPDDEAAWLDRVVGEARALLPLLRPYPEEQLELEPAPARRHFG